VLDQAGVVGDNGLVSVYPSWERREILGDRLREGSIYRLLADQGGRLFGDGYFAGSVCESARGVPALRLISKQLDDLRLGVDIRSARRTYCPKYRLA
jgi:hypothetical protein